jgi:hypothetical protein
MGCPQRCIPSDTYCANRPAPNPHPPPGGEVFRTGHLPRWPRSHFKCPKGHAGTDALEARASRCLTHVISKKDGWPWSGSARASISARGRGPSVGHLCRNHRRCREMRRHFLGDKGFTEQKVPSHFAVSTAPDARSRALRRTDSARCQGPGRRPQTLGASQVAVTTAVPGGSRGQPRLRRGGRGAGRGPVSPCAGRSWS